jgi:hypothetical protein
MNPTSDRKRWDSLARMRIIKSHHPPDSTIHLLPINPISFPEVVGLLENARVAEEGFEVVLDFQGTTYILGFAGDSRGIIRSK